MQVVNPKIFVIAATALVQPGKEAFLEVLGVPGWKTDAASDAEELIEIAGKNCYLSFSTDLNKNLTRTGTRNNLEYIQEGLIGTGHGSVLEHATVTFAAVDVSRVMTHELVRHRVGAAYSQQSGRYVRTDVLKMYIPPEIRENKELMWKFIQTCEMVEKQYAELVKISGIEDMKDFGLKKRLTSALRRVRPNGESNSIVFTYNHRTIRQTIEARTSAHAEEEIRVCFFEMFKTVQLAFPAIYKDAITVPHTLPGRVPEVIFNNHKI